MCPRSAPTTHLYREPRAATRTGTEVTSAPSLAEQHRYEELRDFYRSDVRGWLHSYDFEGIDSWLALLANQNDLFPAPSPV